MRILHTMLRVGDLETSIKFYTEVLKMKLLRKSDYPGGKFTLAFVGYGDEATNAVLELTHNWEINTYDIGSAYGHIAIEVNNIYEVCEKIKEMGSKIIRSQGSKPQRIPNQIIILNYYFVQ